jgi:hypothetical protein
MRALGDIFRALERDGQALAAKTRGTVKADFLWPARGLAIEVDEVQHFTRFRALTFRHYPPGTALMFRPPEYLRLCNELHEKAERAYAHVLVAEFPGPHSRARQRAYLAWSHRVTRAVLSGSEG